MSERKIACADLEVMIRELTECVATYKARVENAEKELDREREALVAAERQRDAWIDALVVLKDAGVP